MVRHRRSPPHRAGEKHAASVYAFSWGERYLQLERQYQQLVQLSADTNLLMELLRQEPCHVAVLEQVFQIAQQTGQLEVAAEFLERVLWAYEASYHPSFVQAWLRGDARMLAGLPANAPFFRALHAQTMAISRRGCHVAALSTALLTLSLDRVSDPTRMRLLIDGLALRAERAHTLWLLDQSYQEELRQLPGWAFSIALALRQIHSYSSAAPPIGTAAAAAAAAARGESEWEDGGTAALRRALLTFPAMLPAALQSCCGGNPAATALSARWQRVVSPLIAVAELHFGSATLQHMHALYWERVSDIWKHDAL
ncbi:hypothetical protein AB1Y20_017680, partial [Prymnesium parvum]